jgi:hypothetical protein
MAIKILKQSIVVFFFLLAGGGVSLYLGQDANWDFLNYHLYNPYAFFENRVGYDEFAANIQSYLPPMLDIPLYLLVKHFNEYPRAITFTQGLYYGLLCYFAFCLNYALMDFEKLSRWIRIYLSCLATILGATGFSTFSQVGTSFNEIQNGCIILFCIYILAVLFYKKKLINGYPAMLYVGLLAGMAFGLKYTMAIFGIAFFLTWVSLEKGKDIVRKLIWYGLFCLLGFLAIDGFWAYKLYHVYGNPFFPFFNKIFSSPYYPSVNFSDTNFHPKSFLQYVIYPLYWSGVLPKQRTVAELHFIDPRFLISYLLVFFWMGKYFITGFVKNKNFDKTVLSFKTIIFFWFFSYFIFLFKFSIIRYVVALECLSGLILIFTLAYFLQKKPKTLAVATSLIVLLVLATTEIPSWGRIKYANKYYSIEGRIPDDHTVLILNPPCTFVIPGLNPKGKVIGIINNQFEPVGDDVTVITFINSKAQKNLSRLGLDLQTDCKHLKNNYTGFIYICSKHQTRPDTTPR